MFAAPCASVQHDGNHTRRPDGLLSNHKVLQRLIRAPMLTEAKRVGNTEAGRRVGKYSDVARGEARAQPAPHGEDAAGVQGITLWNADGSGAIGRTPGLCTAAPICYVFAIGRGAI
jgi:hypothetical protein